jgi:hypothetical protein
LREGLYQTLDLSCAQASGSSGANTSSASVAPPKAESSTTISEEVAMLREENNKLKYRVSFLVKTIEEVENKASAKK